MTHEEILKTYIGNYVEDCRGKMLKIVNINIEPSFPLLKSFRKICWLILPFKFSMIVQSFVEDMFYYLGWFRIYDKDLLLEDGSECSARNCCSYIYELTKEEENELYSRVSN